MKKREFFRLPVVSLGAEFLVMGNLLSRNILTYKAPEGNEGYDLISIHPEPRYKPKRGEKSQIRVQVKSRYATDCNKGFPVKKKSLDAFDYLIVCFLNIGKFYGKNDGSTGMAEPVFYTLSQAFIRKHHDNSSNWEKFLLTKLIEEIQPFKNELGFELIAKSLGVSKPIKAKIK